MSGTLVGFSMTTGNVFKLSGGATVALSTVHCAKSSSSGMCLRRVLSDLGKYNTPVVILKDNQEATCHDTGKQAGEHATRQCWWVVFNGNQ